MIYVVKGAVNSSLLDTTTSELRVIANTKLDQIDNDSFLSYQSLFSFSHYNSFLYRLCDIKITKNFYDNPDFEIIKGIKSAYNIRLIVRECPNNVIGLIEKIIEVVIGEIVYAGIVFLTDNENLIERVNAKYDWIVCSKLSDMKDLGNTNLYKPEFVTTQAIIQHAQSNNIYFFSRKVIELKESKFIDMNCEKNNISKSIIKTCSICEYREVCFDNREVLEKDET